MKKRSIFARAVSQKLGDYFKAQTGLYLVHIPYRGTALAIPDLARLSTGLNQALQEADVKERLARLGIGPVGGTPQQFAAMADADRAKWKKIISDRKIASE